MRQAILLAVAAVVAVGLVGCVPQKKGAAGPGEFVLRVNAGADKEYTDQAGVKWMPDQDWKEGARYGADGGKTVTRQNLKITDTKAPDLYLTEHYSMTAYRFEVPNGKYTVRLHFAETYENIRNAGERIFTVAIQGKPVMADFDVFKEAKGFAKPLVKTFNGVEVTGGKLVIEFTPKVQNPEINGIEILGG